MFGAERGTPIDRHYIQRFLATHRAVIRGACLEIAESTYTHAFGSGVARAEVMHVDAHHPGVTVVADLSRPESLPQGLVDCFICTQTLNFVFDVPAAVRSLRRVLRPGGTVLATVAGLTQISRYDMDRWGDYWRFTSASLARLFGSEFPEGVAVTTFGNVLGAKALLDGLAVEDLPDPGLLDRTDPDYQIVLGVAATRHS